MTNNEFYSFLSNLDDCYFFCLIAVARTSNAILNKTAESAHPYLVPDRKKNAFSFSSLNMMLGVGLSNTAFIMLRNVPSILC